MRRRYEARMACDVPERLLIEEAKNNIIIERVLKDIKLK